MRSILVDTGAIVGLLRPSDRHHDRVERFFTSLSPRDGLLTTWPVITECGFIMRRQEEPFWSWLLESKIEIADFTLEDVAAMREWRARYDDREVDFADASLVWLGQTRRTNLIATTDFDDFEVYRLKNGKRFINLIERP